MDRQDWGIRAGRSEAVNDGSSDCNMNTWTISGKRGRMVPHAAALSLAAETPGGPLPRIRGTSAGTLPDRVQRRAQTEAEPSAFWER